jgi:hypothetical protein
MSIWPGILIAGIVSAGITWLALDRAISACNDIQRELTASMGDYVVACEKDSDCELHAVQCPWKACITNMPVNKPQHEAVQEKLARFTWCAYLPPYRQKQNACLEEAAKTDCTRPYRNVSCAHRICMSW